MKNFINVNLKIRRNINQFKRHNVILIMFKSTSKDRFSFIFFKYKFDEKH